MTNALTIFNQLRPHTIGYDNIFDHFNDMFESSGMQTNYPPYDIIKHDDNKYDIQVALAGYSKEDITVEVKENTLSIKSIKVNNLRGISNKFILFNSSVVPRRNLDFLINIFQSSEIASQGFD